MRADWIATVIAVLVAAEPAAASENSIQSRFLTALALINQGHATEAAELLRKLYIEAPTPRIRLELARALMLAGRLKEARALFVEAFKDNPPAGVRANILAFIDRIDRLRGKLTLEVSFGRYSNPLQQPGAYSFSIGWIQLNYQPNENYRNLWGITYAGRYDKAFADGWSFDLSASYRMLPQGPDANRLVADLSVGRKISALPLDIKVGALRFDQPGQSYTLPYVEATYTQSLSPRRALQPSVRLGYYHSDYGQSLSGYQLEGYLPYVVAFRPGEAIAVGPSIVRHSVGFAEQSYTSVGLRGVVSIRGKWANIEASGQLRVTNFDAVDPFWGVTRKDRGVYAGVSLSSDRVRIGPFEPSLGFSCDINHSNVQYFRQKNCDMLINVKKIF